MIKINRHLINLIVANKDQNDFRYYLLLQLLSPQRSGQVNLDTFIEQATQTFGVQAKTVQNRLYLLQTKGWVRLYQNWVYLTAQDEITGLYQEAVDYSKQAIGFEQQHLQATLKEFRALLYSTVISHKTGQKTIARETIHSLTGHSRQTQRNYEQLRKTNKRFNYGIVSSYNNETDLMDITYQEFCPVFTTTINGTHVVARQIPNTYETQLKIYKRKYYRVNNVGTRPDTCKRYFNSDTKSRLAVGDYVQLEKQPNWWVRL